MSNPSHTEPVRILHLEDNDRDHELVQAMLESEGIPCEMHHVQTREQFEAAIDSRKIDLIVSDHAMPAFDGSQALLVAREKCPATPFIFVTGSLGEESAVEKLKNGATDYVLKHRLERLAPAVRRALEEAAERTRREEAEEQLRRSNGLFHQISGNIQDLIAILNLDGKRLYNSPSYRRLLGDPESLRDTDSFADVHSEDRERIREIFRQTVVTGSGQRTEYRLLTRDGGVRTVESQGSVIRDYQGNVINVLVVSRDITERRHSERHIREQAALLDKAHDAIYVRDLNQRITYWNQGAERLYGWTAAEATGRRADGLLYRGDSPQIQDVRRQVMEKGEWTGELKQFTRDNREVTVQARRTLLYDAQGTPYCILNINTDITEKKLIHEQLLRTQRMESIGALAGGIAHDLNNVLAPILMAADLLRDEVTSEIGQKILDTMKGSAHRGSEMVKQILSFARGTGGEYALLQAKHLIAEMGKLAKDTFPQSIGIKIRIAGNLLPLQGNATQIHQVLLNLCVNARDAMPNGGTLELMAENATLSEKMVKGHERPFTGPFVVLSVSDTGMGIPPHLLGSIFEPFFTTKGVGKGTGIGLSTVMGIVKAHGGFVEVQSEMGRGTTLKVFLPAAQETQAQNPGGKAMPPPEGRGELLLLVDDEMALLEMTKEMLESFNYRVVTATNGADALLLYQQHRQDVRAVITDMMMPVMDGPELIRALRRVDPLITVIGVSGFASHPKFLDAPRPDVCAFLNKPYTTERILTTLHDALAR